MRKKSPLTAEMIESIMCVAMCMVADIQEHRGNPIPSRCFRHAHGDAAFFVHPCGMSATEKDAL